MSRKSIRPVLAGLCLTAVCHTGPTWADDIAMLSLEDLLAAEIDKVSGVSRMEQLIAEAPAAVTVLTHRDIRLHGWRTLADLLRSVPGINVSYNSLYSTASIRGQTSALDMGSFMLLLIDGERLTSNISDASLLGEDMPIDLEWIDRVEIITGASSAVYGSNAVLVVVNIITHPEADLASVEATLDAGSGDHRAWRVAGKKRFQDGGHMAVSASQSTSDGYFDNDVNETSRWFARIAKGDFTLTALHIRRGKSYPHLEPPLLTDGRMNTDYGSATLNWRKDLTNSLHADVSLQYGESDSTVGFGNPDLLYRKLRLDGTWRAIDASLTRKLGKHTLLFGFDYLSAPDTSRYGIDFTPALVVDEHQQDMGFSRHALFFQDIWNPLPSLGLHLALRHEKDDRYPGSLDVPRLGLVYQLAATTTFKLNYGESFRAHPAYEVASLPNVVRLLIPDKPPEQVKQWEARLEHELSSASRVDASLYRIRTSDLLRYAPTQSKRDFLIDESSTLAGLEAGILWRQQDGSRLRASVTLQDGNYDSDNGKLFNSPKHLAKLAYSLPLAPHAAMLGFEAVYTSQRQTLLDTAVPSHSICNLTLSSAPSRKNWEWQLGIHNLFDQRYTDPSSYTLHLGEIEQEGRSWRARFKLHF